jgi:spermidine synthase
MLTVGDDLPVTLARVQEPLGEIALRRRTDRDSGEQIYELIVNGVFTMDTVDTSTEELLAEAVLRRVANPHRVVIGGLGLGFTTARVLLDGRVRSVDVVELSEALPRWIRAGMVPATAGVLSDHRVRLHTADVADWLPAIEAGSVDAILLDVDNGPDFLIYGHNAALYEASYLGQLTRVLRAGGCLGVWSAAPSLRLLDVLGHVLGPTESIIVDIEREGRLSRYALYLATLPH